MVSPLGFRVTGKRAFGCVKRELIVVGGKQAAASKAWRSPKPAVNDPSGHVRHVGG
jgi:hypothetical protein